jgi:predicted RNA binding protein YcfA (HicA-like mRNA interferase family)
MKWSEIVRLAEANGWKFVKHGKKHDIYQHPEKTERLLIERHWNQEVRKGLYNRIKKMTGF